jgi:hypothetical protein
MAEMIDQLEQHNPELLDMAAGCATDLAAPAKAMVGFSMFYRLLIAQSPLTADTATFIPLPRPSVPC